MTKSFLTIVLFLVFVSCNPETDNKIDKIKFSAYHFWISNPDSINLKETGTFLLETKKITGKTEYDLKSTTDDSISIFTYSIVKDSLFFEDQYCKVIDTIKLDYKGKTIQLLVSDYDEENSADEESYLFWNSTNGVLGQYNWSM